MVDDRYEVFATHGRGVFSSVLRAKDLLSKAPAGSQQEVAIKIIRANETMCAHDRQSVLPACSMVRAWYLVQRAVGTRAGCIVSHCRAARCSACIYGCVTQHVGQERSHCSVRH